MFVLRIRGSSRPLSGRDTTEVILPSATDSRGAGIVERVVVSSAAVTVGGQEAGFRGS